MNTKTQDTEITPSPEHEEQGHVHGPNCNHGHSKLMPIKRETSKVGRNDDCPCGSQKKHKKCCGN
ncbi:MAG: SEC-C domain-containing protein [Bdellovibrionales bacterium]|nr:SEC-C domain-containing protein [Bdellovibrionales bacterium]